LFEKGITLEIDTSKSLADSLDRAVVRWLVLLLYLPILFIPFFFVVAWRSLL
jgi:hypothetical protein